MALIELGLFDIQQIDPLDEGDHQAFYTRHLDDLALADSLGLDIAFVAERHYLTTFRCQASSVWLGAATQRTQSMRLGTLAYTVPITPPVRLAEEIALLDQISGGRIEVGLGLGHRVEELEVNAIDPAHRIDIFQERVAIMEGLWAGGTVSYESGWTSVKEAYLHPRPIQQPNPPLWFAGTDPTSAMWAGQHGMNLAIGFASSDQLFGATAAFRHGVGIRRTRQSDQDSVRRGQIALMRHVYIGESDAAAATEMIDDLVRLGELNTSATEANRSDRRQQAAEHYAHLIEKEVFISGGPELVAKAILDGRNKLGSNVFLGNVYAAGIEPERVRRSITLLATEVRDALDSLVTRIE
jgi:alkanesulfonate monooxygenase SsuD/methylene tetrahydromethanopterin reductase-like flavin-dependent oxidoreductase (luciferase family)